MSRADKRGQRLREIAEQLPEAQAQALLEYAEFLLERHGVVAEVASDPLQLPRPDNETVVGAIKRLRANYPMLDTTKLLNETSTLMSDHALRGRDASAVIDELELLFRRHYEQLLATRRD